MAKATTKAVQETPSEAHTTTSEPSESVGALVPLSNTGMQAYGPAYAAELAAAAKNVASQERPSMSKLSIKGGILAYAGQPCPNNELEVVVLATISENSMYIDKYNPNVIVSPRCFALSESGEDMEPHANVDQPFGDEDGKCVGCEFAKWLSDPGGGRGKACKERRRLVMVPKDAVTGTIDDLLKAEMSMLNLPVMSVQNWGTYINKLAASSGLPYYAVVTKVKVVPDARSQFRVTFEGVAALPKEMIEGTKRLKDAAVSYGMSPYDAYVAPPPPANQTGKAKKF
jgi:hypothetical protein